MGLLGKFSRLLGNAVRPSIPAKSYRVAIVGGGSSGVSVASQLIRKFGYAKGDIAIVEPKDRHFYQPLWTMVGGLGLDVEQSYRPQADVLPEGAEWIKERCEAFDPANCKITLGSGHELEYEVLVIAAGIEQNFSGIRGLADTIGKNGVASIYSYDYSPLVWQNIQKTNSGRALFTVPSTAINCGGAPQKVCYLAENAWRARGVRDKMRIQFFTPSPAVFACPHYAKALDPLMRGKGIEPNMKANLVEVDGDRKVAMFERESGEIFHEEFDFLHVTPPMHGPTFLEDSGLVNANGFVEVDKETCQHVKYPNVFSLGDCSALPTSKTYSAIAAQSPVVVNNIQAVLQNRRAVGAYDGYSACPILTGDNKLMLAEFNGYTMEPQPTFPLVDQRVPNFPFFLMKRFVFEQMYWHLMPIGRWYGKNMIFEPTTTEKIPGKALEDEKNVLAVMPEARAVLLDDIEVAGSIQGAVRPSFLGVETPPIPGNVSLCGALPEEAVKALGPRYKGWLYLNQEDNPHYFKQAVLDSGCELEHVHVPGGFSGGTPTKEHAIKVIESMRRLPRPLMIQCNSGNRSGAVLLLWLAKKSGRSLEMANQLAEELNLKFFRCGACQSVRDWLKEEIGELPKGFNHQEETRFSLEQLFDPQGSSTFTYLVGCNETKEAVLIDPVLGNEVRDMLAASDRGLAIKYVVNTHCHADHVTSGGSLKKLIPELKTIISKASGAKADIYLEDTDKIKIGKYHLEARAVPGHTNGCMAFVLCGPGDPLVVFSGDAVLIRGCGRTDFQQGSAESLYDNVHKRIFTLPESTKIYPGHDYKGRNLSTVREEKRFNPRLTKSKDEFVEIMNNLNLPYPAKMDVALPANMKDGEE